MLDARVFTNVGSLPICPALNAGCLHKMPPLSLRGAEDSITHVPWGFGCSSSRPITSPRNVTEALGGLLAFSEDGGDCLLPFQALQLLTVAVSLLHPPSPPNTQTPSILFSASTITISNMFTRSGCQSPGCFTKFMNVDFFFSVFLFIFQ